MSMEIFLLTIVRLPIEVRVAHGRLRVSRGRGPGEGQEVRLAWKDD
jgi:hypothetical protein